MHHVGHVDWDFSEPPAGYAGSAEGYASSCLVGSHTGAVHTELSISKLEPGGWTGLHLHSFESAVYVLAGTPVLNIDGHQNQLRAGDYALLPIGQRPADTFFLPVDAAAASVPPGPVSRFLGHYAGTPPQQEALRVDDRVRDREPAGMDTALLAYSGISVKMMVDRGLGAELLVMFMVDYEPGGAAQAHDHPFEEAYFFLEGEIEAEVDGIAYKLRAGDVLFAGVGSTHGFYNTGRGRVRWIETQAPQPPGRHSYRWTGPWQRLESQTSGNTGRPWLRI